MMKELDFSRISNKALEEVVENQPRILCSGISCEECPFHDECCNENRYSRMKAFQEEYKRRQKMKNKMPELEAGMIVELEDRTERYLYLKENWAMRLDGKIWSRDNRDKIIAVYKYIHDRRNFKDLSYYERHELIWERKSEKQQQKEALLEKIEELKQQVEELDNE